MWLASAGRQGQTLQQVERRAGAVGIGGLALGAQQPQQHLPARLGRQVGAGALLRQAAPRGIRARGAAHQERLHEIGGERRGRGRGVGRLLAKQRIQRIGQAGVEGHEIEQAPPGGRRSAEPGRGRLAQQVERAPMGGRVEIEQQAGA